MLRHPFVSVTILASILAVNAGCNPLEGREFAPGGENKITTQGAGGGDGGDDSDTETPGTGDPNGPTLSIITLELEDVPNQGPSLVVELGASDPQEDVLGGTLFVTLTGDDEFKDNFDITAAGGGDDVLFAEGVIFFGITELDLAGEYAYEFQAKDDAGNTGSAISGDVPPYEG